jgi:hypothetical protein
VAERLVVPVKPGNSGGGKGPQFKASVESVKGPGALTQVYDSCHGSAIADGAAPDEVDFLIW